MAIDPLGTFTCTGEQTRSCELEPTTALGPIWANDGGDKVPLVVGASVGYRNGPLQGGPPGG